MIIELTDDELAIARVALRDLRNSYIETTCGDDRDDWLNVEIARIQRLHDRLVRQ